MNKERHFKKDLTGNKYGKLTVPRFSHWDRNHSYWVCQCNCLDNEIKIVRGNDLKNGAVSSCSWGCTVGAPKLSHLETVVVPSPPGHEWISFQIPSDAGTQETVIIDAEDLEKLKPFRWRAHKTKHTFYVRTKVGRKTVRLHRVVLGLEESDLAEADHFDGNGLNNTKRKQGGGNLRLATRALNMQNRVSPTRAIPRGVSQVGNKWMAQLKVRSKTLRIGYFDTIDEAATAASAARKKHFSFTNEARVNGYKKVKKN